MKIPVSQGVITGTTQRVGDAANPGGYRQDNAAMGVFSAIMSRQQQVWQKEQAQEENSAKLQLDDVLTTDFSNKVTDLKNRVGNGALTAEQANQDLTTWSNDRYAQLEEGLPQRARPQLKNYWSQSVNNQRGSFFPLEIKAREQNEGVVLDKAFNVATRLPTAEREPFFKSYLDSSSRSEAEKAQRMELLRTESNKIDLDSRILSAVNSGNIDDLNALVTDLDKGSYGYLSGGQVQDYKASVSSKIHTLQSRQQIEENKRISESNKVFTDFKQAVLTGRNLDPSYVDNVRTAVNGTTNQADFEFYIGQSSNFQKFSKLSTTEQLKKLNEQKALLKNTSTADPVREEKVMNVYQSIYDEKIKLAKDNPSQILAENGIQLPEINPSLIKLNPQGLAKNLVTVGSYQLAMKKDDANIAIKPISSDQLPQAIDEFDKSSVDQKLNFISNLLGQAKGISGGKQIWSNALEQLGGGDRVYLLAGLAKNKNRAIGNQNLADTLINGQFLVDKGGFVLPTALEQKFRELYGNLNTLGNYADDLKQFQLSYASIANSNNIKHLKKDDVPDTNTIKKAFDLATGGVYEQEPNSWFGSFKTPDGASFKKWQVPKPYGMGDDKFESLLDQGYESLAKQSGYQVAELKQFLLVPRISKDSNFIMYNLVDVRGRKLKGPNGKEQFIIFNGVTR